MYDGEPGDSLDMDMHGICPSVMKGYDRDEIEPIVSFQAPPPKRPGEGYAGVGLMKIGVQSLRGKAP
jgi:hypothetical protein